MKSLNNLLFGLLSILLIPLAGSAAPKNEKGNLSITVNYFVTNNQVPYLRVIVKTKIDGKFQTVDGVALKLFLTKDSTGNLISNVTTNARGEAVALIPPSVKKEWEKTSKHTFLASFAGNAKYEATTGDVTISRAKILIDTGADKKITATVLEMKDTAWTPVSGVELKIGVSRSGADLPVNETPTYTTDSTGKASADFKRDSIPGDAKGNIMLVAKVEDNDQYGNLSISKKVQWGAKFIPVDTFGKRTLFATGDKAPFWLLFIVCSILTAVWVILIVLVINIFKIKKMGTLT